MSHGSQDWALAHAVTPQQGEAFSGYLRRLVGANGLGTIGTLADLTGRRIFGRPASTTWATLSKLTGLAENSFDPVRLAPFSSRKREVVCSGGQAVRSNQIATHRMRACPTCVAEEQIPARRIVLAEWQIHLVTACAKHDVQLLDECSACSRAIGYADSHFLWACPNCGLPLGDMAAIPATEAEKQFRAFAIDHTFGLGIAPSIDTIDRLSLVERLGRVALLAADDRPTKGLREFHGRDDAFNPRRPIAESRLVVEAALPLVADWPNRLHELLAALVDRHPSDNAEYLLRRFGSEAGRLAMSSLYGLPDRLIEPYEAARLDFVQKHFGYRFGSKPSRRSTVVFNDMEQFARAASLRDEEYVGAKEAAQLLGGSQPITLRAWVEAELLEIHRRSDGTHSIPRGALDTLLDRLRLFPFDDGDHTLVDLADLRPCNVEPYRSPEFYVDLMTGHIRAAVRYPDRTGLPSLAISTDDLQRRRASAWFASRALANTFHELRQITEKGEAIWERGGTLSRREARELLESGKVRGQPAACETYLSARDALIHLQGRTGNRAVFHLLPLYPLSRPDRRFWREIVSDAPVMPGLDDMPLYGVGLK